MKLTKSEYEELIRKKPSLRPTEVIKSQNTHHLLLKGHDQFGEPVSMEIPLAKKGRTKKPAFYQLSIEQRTPLSQLPEALRQGYDVEALKVRIQQENIPKSPRTLIFTIPGQPVGKPRMTQQDKWMKRTCVMRYRAWENKAIASVPSGVSLGVYRQISFIAYLEFPKSYSTTKRAWLTGQPHLQKPDSDNILKGLMDSLFSQDRVIWKFSGEKRWDDGKGARVEVELK